MNDRPITEILADLRAEGREGFDELLPIVYAELRRVS